MKPIVNIYELSELEEMLAEGYISVRPHPTAPLRIYNYTAKAQYANVWNAATLTCRGLIADATGKIVARPFAKFFNLDQLDHLPDEPFEVYEKLDGSLGILYLFQMLDGRDYSRSIWKMLRAQPGTFKVDEDV